MLVKLPTMLITLRKWSGRSQATVNAAIAPELDPGWSAWGVQQNPHGPGAVLGSIGDSVATQFEPEGEQRLFRIVAYRDMPATFIVYDYTLFVRNDLLPLFNSIRY